MSDRRRPIDPTPARPRMLRRIRRLGATAGVALLTVFATSLFLATGLALGATRDDLGPEVTLSPLVAPLAGLYLLLLVLASCGAAYMADRAARVVETLFEHQDRLMLAVAHEIRSPLSRTVVALDEGSIGIIASEDAIAEARVYVGELSSLLDDLLQTARIMSGAAALPTDEVRLDEVARDAFVGESLGASSLLFDTCPVLVVGSPHLLRRAVVNLIRNAAVHGYGESGGEIRVRVDLDGVGIEDDGPGVPPAELDELRYETPLSRRRSRSGLGLLLAGWVAEAHRGRLVLRNRFSGGFEARLDLPARDASPNSEGTDGP